MQQIIIKILKNFVNLLKDIRNYYRFPRAYIAYRGVFRDFKEAQESSPNRKSQTYSDEIVEKNTQSIFTTQITNMEYPFFFWLHTLLSKNQHYRVFDFGGGYGGHYFHYAAATHTNPQWIVCELPHKVEVANEVLEEEIKGKNLFFTSDISASHQCNILVSSGAFQYIEDLLGMLKNLLGGGQEYVLLTRLPMQTTKPTFVSLQNVHNSFFTPYHIFNKAEFIQHFINLGYELVDMWDDPFDSITLPFHRDIDIHFCGFYFRLRTAKEGKI